MFLLEMGRGFEINLSNYLFEETRFTSVEGFWTLKSVTVNRVIHLF